MRILQDMASSGLSTTKAPADEWPEAIRHANWIKIRMPIGGGPCAMVRAFGVHYTPSEVDFDVFYAPGLERRSHRS